MSRELLARIVLGSLGLATAAWYFLPTTDFDEIQGLALVAIPFVLLLVFYRRFWSVLVAGLVILIAFWYSLIFIKVDGHSTASLIFLITLPIMYASVILGLLVDRLRRPNPR